MKPVRKLNPGFSRKEMAGILTLLTLIAILYIGAHFIQNFIKRSAPTKPEHEAWLLAAATLQAQTNSEDSLNDYPRNNGFAQNTAQGYFNSTTRSLFYFNPNELSAEGWQKLGINPKTVRTIINYRNKGGKFRKAEDLQRIYGLSKTDYAAIAPYVQITAVEKPNYPSTANTAPNYDKPSYPAYTKKSYSNIDINLADTAGYIALPGIGSALARKIINFRDKLGGFYRVEQVGETYGVPDSTFQKIKPYLQTNMAAIKKLNINTASVEILREHPYLRPHAKSIVAYRQQHGLFKSIDDIQKIMSIDGATYEKIKHYITID